MQSVWDTSADFVSVGSGLGGCAAAVAAADSGLEALVLEKSAMLGGSTSYSYGILWIPNNHLQRRQGVEDTTEQGKRYMVYLGGGRASDEHIDAYLHYAPLALEYFERIAEVPFYLVEGLPDHYYPAGPGSLAFGRNIQVQPFWAQSLGEWQGRLRHSPYIERVTFEEMLRWGGRNERNWNQAVLAEREAKDVRTFGSGLIGYFARSALSKGVRILPETAAERLVIEEGEVRGLEARRGGERLRIQARKGVLLATGAYSANPRLVGWLDEFPPFPTHRPPAATLGDGIVLAMEHGAAIFIQHGTLSMQLAYSVPGETAEGLPMGRGANLRELAAPHSILVNRDGERFADESFFEHIAFKMRDLDLWGHRYTNRPCFLIFDRQFWDTCGINPIAPGGAVPGWITHAATIEGLATQLGINPERLRGTVERFNQFAEAGRDLDFHRGEDLWARQMTGDLGSEKNPNLGPVSTPPYYGLELHPSDARAAGLVTNTRGQVIHVRGHPIPGLYACGDVAAQMHAGLGYQAGYILTGAMTFGYLAVQDAKARG